MYILIINLKKYCHKQRLQTVAIFALMHQRQKKRSTLIHNHLGKLSQKVVLDPGM